MKKIFRFRNQHFNISVLSRLSAILFFLATLNVKSQTIEPPYTPCALSLSSSECLTGTHSCDEVQPGCSSGYCWSSGVPSINAGIPLGGLVQDKVIEIGGQYNVTVSAVFKNCTFRMSGDARINILPSGASPINVSFENCNIFGCGEMWQGIVIDATNALDDFTFNFSNCNIEDAYIGLQLDEFKGNYSVSDNSFRNNHIGITNVRKNGGFLNASVVRNHFWQSAELAKRVGSLDDPFPMPDYPLAYAGVKYVKVVSSVGVLETMQTGGTANVFECLIHGIVTETATVQSISNVFQKMRLNGVFATDGAIRVVSCQFLENGITGILAIGATLKAQGNLFSGVWDEGIHSAQNLNNEQITINENNQFIVTAARWFYGIYVERPQALLGKHCIIDGNSFNVSSNPSNGLGFECIRIEDFVAAKDEMEISANNILVNSSKGGINGIHVNMGNSNQLNVHDNIIHFGTITDTWINYGIYLFSAGGQDLSEKHIIRQNIVTGINTDSENALYCGIHSVSIDETEYCSNVVDQCYIGMHFSNVNDIELRSNHFNNHTYGLRVAPGPDARIGEQRGRGNQWDLDPDACIDFAAQVMEGDPLNSHFIVPQDIVLPWLPPNNKIDPDPSGFNSPNWFHAGGGMFDAICKSPLEPPYYKKLTPSEKEAVLGISVLTGVHLWDLKRDLYAKLLIYNDLRPVNSPEEIFFNNLNGTALAYFAQVTLQVQNSLSLSPSYQTAYDIDQVAIEQAIEDLAVLDGSIDYSNIGNLTEIWFAQRAAIIQQVIANIANRQALEDSRNQQISSSLQSALTYNTNIALTTQPYEMARKAINEIRIRQLLGQPKTLILYQLALYLAQQDPGIVGEVAEEVVRFLAPCDQGTYWDTEVPTQEREGITKNFQSASKPILQVVPNPTQGVCEVTSSDSSGGYLSVYNTQGQRIKTLTIEPGVFKFSLDLGQFSNGFYWLELSNETGKTLYSTKIFLSH